MKVNEAAEHLCQLLSQSGFNFQRPSAMLVWQAFKLFVTKPIDAPTTDVWFESGGGNASMAYFDFVRMVTHYGDDADWSEQITAHFTAAPEVESGVRSGYVGAKDLNDLETWFTAVESSAAFKAGTNFSGWSFEVRIDGC